MPTAMRNPFAWTNVSSGKNACFAIWPHVGTKFFNLSHHFLSMDGWPGDAIFFPVGPAFEDHPQEFGQKKVQPLGFYFLTPAPRPLQVTFFWLVKLNICGCTLLQSHVKNHTPSINHGTCFSWGLTFRYVLVNSHLIHPPSNSWLLTLGILQTYTLSESFMIDFPDALHTQTDRSTPPSSQQTEIDFLSLYVRKLSGKKSGLFWYDILFLAPYHAPGPSPTIC